MNRCLLILADLDVSDLLQTEKAYFNSPRTREYLAMWTALLMAIVASISVAVVYARKKKKRRRYHHHHHSITETKVHSQPRWRPWLVKPRRRRRKRRHSHRPMNPTLAETGGLPPLRDENEPPPAP